MSYARYLPFAVLVHYPPFCALLCVLGGSEFQQVLQFLDFSWVWPVESRAGDEREGEERSGWHRGLTVAIMRLFHSAPSVSKFKLSFQEPDLSGLGGRWGLQGPLLLALLCLLWFPYTFVNSSLIKHKFAQFEYALYFLLGLY